MMIVLDAREGGASISFFHDVFFKATILIVDLTRSEGRQTMNVRTRGITTRLLLILVLICSLAESAPAEDVAHGKDHPMLSRYPDTHIVAYNERYHDIAYLPSAPKGRKGFTEGQWVKGRFTWITYEGPASRSTLEIYRNYEKALKDAGFELTFSCKKEECGYRFINAMLDVAGRMPRGGERWIPDSGRYLAAQLQRDEGDAWVSLLLYERNQEGVPVIRLEIVESNAARKLEQLPAEQVGTKSINYDEAKMAAGTVSSGKFEDILELEGQIEWEAFRHDETVSAFEAFSSFQNNLEARGYRILFECHLESCGSSSIRKLVDLNENIIKGGERWSSDSGHYFLAKLTTPQQMAYAAVLTYRQPNWLTVSRMLSVVPDEMEFDLITVTGESMADEIEKSGKVAVYGIYFDTDSAEIQAESDSTISEIARLLELRPGLSLYVDGHTDSEGTDDYNQDLSARRAESVVAELLKEHGITAVRLESRGFGESQPVASNDSEAGRAWNRRVELVAK